MKKLVILFLSFVCVITMTSCFSSSEENKYALPDLTGKTFIDSIVCVNNQVKLTANYVKTNQYLPDQVIGYENNEIGDMVTSGSDVIVNVAAKPDNAFSLDSKVNYVSNIGLLTGFDSINGNALREVGVNGTDLGIPVDLGNEIIFLFGDSFSNPKMTGTWYSNFIARTTDKTLYDGILFNSLVTRTNGMLLPFSQGKHQSGSVENTGSEVTKIPTGGIKIGNNVYVFYMSIRYWGVSGEWLVNYNQCIKSTDLVNWKEVSSLKFDEAEASNFGQIYPFKDPNSEYIYLYGIPGGRNGGCVVGRTTEKNFEDRNQIEYLVSNNNWVKGDSGLLKLNKNPYYVLSPNVSEMSVMYNRYLKKYVAVYLKNSRILMYQSDTPYGPFSNPITLVDSTKVPSLYGGFVLPALCENNDQSFYITVSDWTIYNVHWMKVVLK